VISVGVVADEAEAMKLINFFFVLVVLRTSKCMTMPFLGTADCIVGFCAVLICA
jgi:hypothetical protein